MVSVDMSPNIAALVCITFILTAFVVDVRRKANNSIANWIPLIWLLIIGSRPVIQWYGSGPLAVTPDEYLQGSAIDRTILSALIISGLFILARRKGQIEWANLLKSNIWILLWFLYCGVSILWSDFPDVSVKRWIKGVGSVVMVLVVLTDPNPIEAVRTVIRRCAYILIPLSVLFIKYFRHLGVIYSPWGGEPNLAGVATDKNALGRLCLVSGFFVFVHLLTVWRRDGSVSSGKKDILIDSSLLLVIAWLLLKIDSATAVGAFIVGASAYIVLGFPIIRENSWRFRVLAFVIIPFLVILLQLFNPIELVVEGLGRNMSLTDRTILWDDLLAMDTSPLIGVGYGSFWLGERLEILWDKYWWKPNEAHNGYLEVYLETGIIGLGLLMGVVLFAYRNIRKAFVVNYDYARVRLAFLVIVLLYNVTESAFRGVTVMWFMFLLMAMEYPRSYGEK